MKEMALKRDYKSGLLKHFAKPPITVIFNEIASVAARFFDADSGLVVFSQEGHHWIEGQFGLDLPELQKPSLLMEQTLSQAEPLVISELEGFKLYRQDSLLAANKDINFYYGISLFTQGGIPAGALVVLDSAPRTQIDRKTQTIFQGLARIAFTATRFWHQLLLIADEFEDLIAVVDKSGNRIYQNKSHKKLFGRTDPGQMANSFAAIHPEDRPRIRDLFERTLRNAKGELDDFRMVLRDGSIHYLESVGTPIFWDSKSVSHVLVVTRDVTKRRRFEEAQQHHVSELEQRANELSSLNKIADLLHRCDNRSDIRKTILQYHEKVFENCSGVVYVFDAFTEHFEEFITWGSPVNDSADFSKNGCWAVKRGDGIHVVEDADPDRTFICEHVRDFKAPYLCVQAQKTDKGNTNVVMYLEFSKETSMDPEERKRCMRAQQQMATAVSKHLALAIGHLDTLERLQRAAREDDLTGLYNRKFMDETLQREIVRNVRYKRTLGVMMVDLDRFKGINDEFGHLCGDHVLREVSKFLKVRTRQTDFLGRFGGEEFLLVVPDSSKEGLLAAAESLRNGVKALELTWNGTVIQVTVSIGVAVYFGTATRSADLRRAAYAVAKLTIERAKQLQDAADKALYEAKEAGRDRVVVATQQ